MKNALIPFVCFSALLVACDTGQKTTRSIPAAFSKNTSGEEHCYTGFVSGMSSLVPAEAYYCGIFGNPNGNSSVRCAKQALESGKPFIIGYQHFGIDSQYCRGVAKQADGQLLSLYYDSGTIRIPVDPNNSGAYWQISRCKKIKLKPDRRGNPYFETNECVLDENLIMQVIKTGNN